MGEKDKEKDLQKLKALSCEKKVEGQMFGVDIEMLVFLALNQIY